MSLDRQNLDALLQQARWPAASEESTWRLEAVWRGEWNRGNKSAWWIWPLAAAAAVIVGLGSVLVLVLYPPRMSPVVMIQPKELAQSKPALVMMPSRAPTMYERMLVGDLRTKKRAPATGPVQAPVQAQVVEARPGDAASREREAMVGLLRSRNSRDVQLYLEMVVDPQRRERALSILDGMQRPPIDALIDQLGNPHVEIRFAAARALGRINGPATTRALVRLVERNKQKREAIAALLLCRGEDAMAFVSDARHTPALAKTVRAVEIQLQNVQ